MESPYLHYQFKKGLVINQVILPLSSEYRESAFTISPSTTQLFVLRKGLLQHIYLVNNHPGNESLVWECLIG